MGSFLMSDLIIFLPNQQQHSRSKTSCVQCFLSFIAYGQALQSALGAGRQKESLQLSLWNLNICIKKLMRKADWQRWHQSWRHYPWNMFFSVFLHSRSFPLHADWRKSDSSVEGEPQGNWRWKFKFQRRSCKLSARASLWACSQATNFTETDITLIMLVPLYLTSRKCLIEVNGTLGSKMITWWKKNKSFKISWTTSPIIYNTSKVHLKVVRLKTTTLM